MLCRGGEDAGVVVSREEESGGWSGKQAKAQAAALLRHDGE